MRILTLASVLALGLVACNQIAGIKKPEDKAGATSGTGTGDDTTTTDDTASDDTTGKADAGATNCNLSSGCDETTTCTGIVDSQGNGTCSPVGPRTEGQACSASALCDFGSACGDGICIQYCTETQLCSANYACAAPSGYTWGVCLLDCTNDSSICPTGFVCTPHQDDATLSWCLPPSFQN